MFLYLLATTELHETRTERGVAELDLETKEHTLFHIRCSACKPSRRGHGSVKYYGVLALSLLLEGEED